MGFGTVKCVEEEGGESGDITNGWREWFEWIGGRGEGCGGLEWTESTQKFDSGDFCKDWIRFEASDSAQVADAKIFVEQSKFANQFGFGFEIGWFVAIQEFSEFERGVLAID